MSRIADTATVSLVVNGKQALDELNKVESALDDARKKLKELRDQKAPIKSIVKAEKSVRSLERKLDQTQSRAEGVKKALMSMDGMAPRELNRALRTLMGRLGNIQRGSKDWYAHVDAIKTLKARIAEFNADLKDTNSLWKRFKSWADSTWPALDLLKQWSGNTLDIIRCAVDAYADMDQEMANVRKFTGMTAEQVEELNEEFKKFDTRTARLELNKLAQEAGRLGITSKDGILEFVRAADQINVALDDLGEGATLSLSKITDIFGDRKKYGIEQSLLKVGSVINDLSQTSSASAPYIANFTERLSGVGVQANLTVPQIMALGAVLDSTGQKVEAASTAVGQILVRMMQDPAKYAKVAGLEVEKFTKLLREDTNEALLTFLDTLNKAGGLDVLAPMFKDMGENGSRAIATLSSLSKHIDVVRQRQQEANESFQEGISIGKEFDVQNTTVQAKLEKAKNRANELRVLLGQKLYPLMGHLLTSTSAMMKAMTELIAFGEKYKVQIIQLSVSITALIAVSKLHSLWLDRVAVKTLLVNKSAGLLSATMKVLRGIFAIGRVGIVALVNSLAYLRNGLNVTHAMQVRWRDAMSRMPFASWSSLVFAIGTAFYMLYQHMKRVAEESRVIENLHKKAVGQAGEQLVAINLLRDAAKDETLSLEERYKAIQKLNNSIPEYNGQLDETTGKYTENAKALEDYNKALIRKYELEGAREKLAELGKQKAAATLEYQDAESALKSALNNTQGSVGHVTQYGNVVGSSVSTLNHLWDREAAAKKKLADIEKLESKILKAYGAELAKEEAVKPDESEPVPDLTPKATPPLNNDDPAKDRYAQEKTWRERQEAEARIAYAKGEVTYAEHTARMAAIAADYYQKLLDREDLSADEMLKIQADYWEAVNKETVAGNKVLLDEEDRSYQELLDRLRENHEARISQESLTAAQRQQESEYYAELLELAELQHLKNILNLYKEGSDDWLAAQRNYQQKQLGAQERHLKRMESLEKTYSDLKSKIFGLNQDEKNAEFDKQFQALKTVYARELEAVGNNEAEKLRIKEAYMAAELALRKEYNQAGAEDSKSSYQTAIETSAEWLKSDGGQALTQSMSTLTSGMSSIFSGLSSMIQAELEIQTSKIEKRYDKEIELAQGNSYKVAKLEKKKEAEIAKVKNEANKKMFAMQVIQAVAQTAQNALNAYGSAAAIPVVGHVMAPIAAAMAVAAGAIQIASIKKQQQASETQGYSRGGFTKPGPVDEPAGIVHAGEWVASQKLLANPVTMPMIKYLDYVQRTNTIGMLRPEDVSRSITANNTLVRIAEGDGSAALMVSAALQMSRTVDNLTDRLKEPFVTVNTVTGDHGIKQAQDEYSRMMDNVTPKKYRK